MGNKIDLKMSWGKIAAKYQRAIKISTREVHYGPNAPGERKLKLLGNVRNKKVLEIGCGGGQNSIALAKKGAKVTGIDFSKVQLDYAENLAKKEDVNVTFIRLDMKKINKLKEKFDIVLSSFAFQYIADLKPLFTKISKVTKKNGLFVFAMGHPIGYVEEWKKSKKGIAAVIYNYFNKKHEIWHWFGKTRFTDFHHSMTEISDALYNSGFITEKIIEQVAYPPNKDSPYFDPSSYDKRWSQIPFGIIFKCVKSRQYMIKRGESKQNIEPEKSLAKTLSLIKKNPGIRPSELNRLLNRGHSWNLRSALIKKGLIKKKKDGTSVRYFPA